jgi:hypothetical protein
MAHFAKVENNIVTQVIVVSNEDCGNLQFPESEPIGQEFIASIGLDGEWIQTSYNDNFRKKFAGVGFEYHQELDAFIEAKIYNSWVLNTEKCIYESPVEKPTDGKYIWDEEQLNWINLNSL